MTASPEQALLVNEHVAAEMLGIGYESLRKLRLAGGGPRSVRPTGGKGQIYYRRTDLEAWVNDLTPSEVSTPSSRRQPTVVRHRRSKHDVLSPLPNSA